MCRDTPLAPVDLYELASHFYQESLVYIGSSQQTRATWRNSISNKTETEEGEEGRGGLTGTVSRPLEYENHWVAAQSLPF